MQALSQNIKKESDIQPKNLTEAKEIQNDLSKRVKIIPLRKKINFIAGADASFYKDRIVGASCLFSYPTLLKIDQAVHDQRVTFPYIPGYLSFRESPSLIKAIKELKRKPDLIILDGQGIAHPRLIGIASHIGVLLNIPTIGCAKSKLIGEYNEPGSRKGSWEYLIKGTKYIGAVLRTRRSVKPVFVSPGHLIDITDSIKIILECITKYRLPEPVRCAHSLSKKYTFNIH